MSILQFVASNPELTMELLTLVGGAFGLNRWRKKRASTAAEIDRWASAAAQGAMLGIRLGLFPGREDALADFLRRLRELAAAFGIEITLEHEARGLAIFQEHLTKVGQHALAAELHKLHDVAGGALERLTALKAKAQALP